MVFIVAELGANWRGDFEVLKRMALRCHRAGVSAVKLQALSQDLLDRHPEWDWYSNASVTPENIQEIDDNMQACGMEWFVTPCYAQAVDFIDPYVKRFKIRSADNKNQAIFDACRNTGKKIYCSVDRPPVGKMQNVVDYIYCIPKYPTEFGELNFDMIKLLKGYSNHCLDPLACLKAVRYGAEYLEFHLTDNKDDFAIDNKVSFSYSQMEEIMKWI